LAPIKVITRERAERIARAHACSHCLEYSFKRLFVKPSPASHKKELKTAWIVSRTCGICGHEQEIGIAADGDIVYGG
jgi:hypothetical protein